MLKIRLFIFLQYCLPQHTLSRITGWLADSEITWLKAGLIKLFASNFPINIAEASPADYEKYKSFNHFFTRPLQPGARIIDENPNTIVSPADGAISEIGSIQQQQLLQAKGRQYTLTELLAGDEEAVSDFTDGVFSTIYLSPKDYHRVHMPIDGKLIRTIYVPGDLFSVNQATADNVPNLFARNERLVCLFETAAGPMSMILVGAMIVASIETVWSGQVTPQPKKVTHSRLSASISLKKGEEMGRFKLGSTVILLFAKNALQWQELLVSGTSIRLGESLGSQCETPIMVKS